MSSSLTPGRALRDIQHAQQAMKAARKALVVVRQADPEDRPALAERAFEQGWESLRRTHEVLASIPRSAATDEVLTKQIAAQKYATALVVRLRRLARGGSNVWEDLDEADD